MTSRRTPNFVLRAWRETQGMTRPELAEALNRTPSARRDGLTCDTKLIFKWETGRIRWPGPRYQRALHDLTGRSLSALGFTTDPTPGSPPASSLPAETAPDEIGDPTDPASIGDLADLAAELSGRGYSTALDTQPPRLAIGAPDDSNHGHIITVGPCFVLDEVPFSLRPPMPLTLTADAIDALTRLTTCQDTR